VSTRVYRWYLSHIVVPALQHDIDNKFETLAAQTNSWLWNDRIYRPLGVVDKSE
jgi:hypothetical protein